GGDDGRDDCAAAQGDGPAGGGERGEDHQKASCEEVHAGAAQACHEANDVSRPRTDNLPAWGLLRGEVSYGERGRAASLRVGSPAHPRNSPEQISGDPEARRNARARCSGPPCTTPLDYAPCTGPDPPRRGAR